MCYGSQWAKKRSSGCCKPKRLGAPPGRAGGEVNNKTHPWIPPIVFYHKMQNRKLIAGTISWHQNCISRVDWHSWRCTQNGQAHVLRWRQRSPRLRWTVFNLLKWFITPTFCLIAQDQTLCLTNFWFLQLELQMGKLGSSDGCQLHHLLSFASACADTVEASWQQGLEKSHCHHCHYYHCRHHHHWSSCELVSGFEPVSSQLHTNLAIHCLWFEILF